MFKFILESVTIFNCNSVFKNQLQRPEQVITIVTLSRINKQIEKYFKMSSKKNTAFKLQNNLT